MVNLGIQMDMNFFIAFDFIDEVPQLLADVLAPGGAVKVSGLPATLKTAMRTRSLAFLVARSGLLLWTQEFWLRILAISNRYLFKPALVRVS